MNVLLNEHKQPNQWITHFELVHLQKKKMLIGLKNKISSFCRNQNEINIKMIKKKTKPIILKKLEYTKTNITKISTNVKPT